MMDERNRVLVLNDRDLPLFIKFTGKDGKKEYILRTNKEGSSLFINKKEDYQLIA